ncbi:hypothetical protein BH09BAC1_BH09BAC1_11520 [soil metagenome]
MKKNALFLCLVALVFAAVGCGDNKKTPEAVAEEFLTAVDDKDYDKAKTLSTEGTHQMLDLIKGFAGQMPADAKKPEPKKVKECKIEGEKGTCTYCCDEQGAESTLAVVQVNGEWKADMSKEALMGGEGGLEGMGDEPATDEPMMNEMDSTTTTDTMGGM